MSKFKVGDRVRFREFCINYDEDIRAAEGDYGTIISVGQTFVSVELDEPIIISVKPRKIEAVEPTDRKTAFIEELKELLAKYDASIYPNGCVVDGIGFKVGNEDIYYNMNYGFGDFITADNINDYDKEEV